MRIAKTRIILNIKTQSIFEFKSNYQIKVFILHDASRILIQ